MTATQTQHINGIDTEALQQTMDAIKQDHRRGIARFNVTTRWLGNGPKSETTVKSWHLGGEELAKDFSFTTDEPEELLGQNTAPNPQEYLQAAMNSCLLATFVAACSVQGITLESLEIESEGELDLRGFLGLSRSVKPGYESINYTIRVKGNGTQQQFDNVHQWMKQTSPNYWNMANAVALNAKMIVN